MNVEVPSAQSLLSVLLIEDNDLDARMMLRHLEKETAASYRVIRATTLGEALEQIENAIFDCVLLDLSLPDSSGLASIGRLTTAAPATPIVILTGNDDSTTAIDAVRSGAQDFLTKQRVDADLIDRAIRYAVARNHSELQLRAAQEQLDLLHERQRIARDLHDTVIQELFATGLRLQGVAMKADGETSLSLIEAVDRIDNAISQLRSTIAGLHGRHRGESLVEEIDRLVSDTSKNLGFEPSVQVDAQLWALAGDVRRELVASLREMLSNVVKHARASAVTISVRIEAEQLVLRVSDNGVGMAGASSDDAPPVGAHAAMSGFGLVNIRSRAEGLSGRCEIGSGLGGGTTLSWIVPLNVD